MAIKLAGDLSFYFLPAGFSFSSSACLVACAVVFIFSFSHYFLSFLSSSNKITAIYLLLKIRCSKTLFCVHILHHDPRPIRHQTPSLPWFLYQFLTFASFLSFGSRQLDRLLELRRNCHHPSSHWLSKSLSRRRLCRLHLFCLSRPPPL
jgi:hypothetical protein